MSYKYTPVDSSGGFHDVNLGGLKRQVERYTSGVQKIKEARTSQIENIDYGANEAFDYESYLNQNYVNSFKDIFHDKTWHFDIFGDSKHFVDIDAELLNNILLDENGFKSFVKKLENASGKEKYRMYVLAWRVHDIASKINNLSPDTLKKLEEIDAVVSKLINHNHNIFYRKYKGYGVRQSCVRELANDPIQNAPLYEELENIVRGYFPRMTEEQIALLLQGTDTRGICSLAEFVNELVILYDDKEDEFKKDFGYDLYREVNGVKILNGEKILTDIYCFINQDNIKVAMQSPFWFYRGYIVNDDNDSLGLGYFYNGEYYKNTDLIQSWLDSKNSNCKWKSDTVYSYFPEDSHSKISLEDIQAIREQVECDIINGIPVELSIKPVKSISLPLTYYAVSDTYPNTSMDSLEDGILNISDIPHTMMIMGFTHDGIVVSSWGIPYIIKWDELNGRGIAITENTISKDGLY